MTGRTPPGGADRWRAAADLFDELADVPREEQARRLAACAAGDPELAALVERMLDADRRDAALIEGGVAGAAHLGLDPYPPLAPGARVGAFDVVGELGRGGMGIVYEAHDRHLGRPAALKFLPLGGTGADAADRLIAEAKAASALDHPNVATVYQIGEADDGRRFIAMPRYEGETLRARLERGPLPAAEALEIARGVAAGLAAAHRAGIVHRDVTPANIFLTRDGPVKLIDFGIAALVGAEPAGPAQGTVSSMSPEQARGAAPDPRTDVWALGVVLYRMLTGEVPFAGDTTAATVARLRGPEPAPRLAGRREIPARLARVVDRALQKNPAQRYADAAAMLVALDDAAPRRRSGALAAAASLVVAGTLIAGALALRAPAGPAPAPAAAAPPPPVLLVPPLAVEHADSSAAALAAAVLDEVGRRLTMLGRVRITHPDPGVPPDPAAHVLTVTLGGDAGEPRLDAVVTASAPPGVLWFESRPFDRAGLPALSRDLTIGVLRALGVPLSARDHALLAAGFPASVEAYQDFLAGNQLLTPRMPEHLLAAMDRYRAAHTRDTTFVSALARHAYSISLLLDWGWRHPTRSRSELLAEGMALSSRALALDSTSAEAWLARAYLMVASDPMRMTGAPEAFRRAIALDPYNAEAYHQYGQTAMQLGMFGEAAIAYRRAIELQADAAMSLIALGGIAEIQGRRDEALALLDSAVAVAPRMAYARAIRSLLLSYAGRYDEARADAAAAIPLDTTFQLPALAAMAMAVHGLGDSAAAADWLSRATAAAADPGAPTADEAHMLANAQLALGRTDLAVATVARARPRGPALWYLLLHQVFDTLRADPVSGPVLREADPRRR